MARGGFVLGAQHLNGSASDVNKRPVESRYGGDILGFLWERCTYKSGFIPGV